MSVAWALVFSVWFEGKLVFMPPLTFASEQACRAGGERLAASLSLQHVRAPAARFDCVPGVVAPPAFDRRPD